MTDIVRNYITKGTLTQKELDNRRFEELMKIRKICECGHTVFISQKVDYIICDHCWHRVYVDEETEFKHKLLQAMGKRSNDVKQFRKRKEVKQCC